MLQSENITDLLAALVEVQNELVTMPKDSKAYGYNYTNLDTIVSTVKPILYKYGIAYMQAVGGGLNGTSIVITTRIFHKSGQYIEDTCALPTITNTKNNSAQTLGMAITYMRRYTLCAMLGITSDEDTDANTTPQTSTKPVQNKPAPVFKGGESTPAEKSRINELLNATYADGKQVFSKDEKLTYSGYRKEKTAAELIAFIENALKNRRQDAPELKSVEEKAKDWAEKQFANAKKEAEKAEQQEIF